MISSLSPAPSFVQARGGKTRTCTDLSMSESLRWTRRASASVSRPVLASSRWEATSQAAQCSRQTLRRGPCHISPRQEWPRPEIRNHKISVKAAPGGLLSTSGNANARAYASEDIICEKLAELPNPETDAMTSNIKQGSIQLLRAACRARCSGRWFNSPLARSSKGQGRNTDETHRHKSTPPTDG